MSKTLCLAVDANDAAMIAEYCHSQGEPSASIVVMAPGFEARVALESQGIPCRGFSEDAWAIDKDHLSDIARKCALIWHTIPGLEKNKELNAIRQFMGHPVLTMHHSFLCTKLFESLQAWAFMRRVFDRVQPERFVSCSRPSPFEQHNVFIVNIPQGMEREAAKTLCLTRNIAFHEIQENNRHSPPASAPKLMARRMVKGLRTLAKPFLNKETSGQSFPPADQHPCVLAFSWLEAHASQITPHLETLAQKGARVGLCFSGPPLLDDLKQSLHEKKIFAFHKASWAPANEHLLKTKWKTLCEAASRTLMESLELEQFFSVDDESFFHNLAAQAIHTELTHMVPETITELARTQNLLEAFKPDVVFAHYSIHPTESCNVLPARAQGIPTLTFPHGAGYETGVERKTFSTQYYAYHGPSFKKGFAFVFGDRAAQEQIVPIGRPHGKALRNPPSIQEAKTMFNYDPNRPLCLFCDVSGFPQTLEFRHSTHRTIQEILRLKQALPGIQLVYRVHNGPNYSAMSHFFESLDDPDLHFQISPKPLFREIVPAADIVISHQSSTIIESLLSGVRVVYLCALSRPEPGYGKANDAVLIADQFHKLVPLVRNALKNPWTRKTVAEKARPYLDYKLGATSNVPDNTLTDFILKLAEKGPDPRHKGYPDWLKRLTTAAKFQGNRWYSADTHKDNLEKDHDTAS